MSCERAQLQLRWSGSSLRRPPVHANGARDGERQLLDVDQPLALGDRRWIQVIRNLSAAVTRPELAEYLGPGAAYVAGIVPELAETLGDVAPAQTSAESDHARFYLFDAVASFLKRICARRPLVLVFDDLHWADQSSLLLLDFLARDLPEARILAVGTYREAEARTAGAVAELIGGLSRSAQSVPLRGLSESETGLLVERIAGQRPDARLVAAVHRATDGNPFFAREIVRLLAAEGITEALAGERLPIPTGVRGAIRRRMSHLPREIAEALAIGSVVGREFDRAVLEKVSGRGAGEALVRACEVGLLARAAGQNSTYSFVHDVIRETLYEDLEPAQRVGLHRRVGEAMEELHAHALDERAGELAHHFLEAAADGDAPRAIEYCERAGHRALAVCAYEEAAGWYERALGILAHLPSNATRRCDVLLALGTVRFKAGQRSAAQKAFLSAAEVARALGSSARLADAALGFGGPYLQQSGRVDGQLVALLEEALLCVGTEDDSRRARLTARLAMELYWSGETERRVSLGAESVEIARRVGNPATLARCLNANRLARWKPDNAEERLDLMNEMAAAGAQARDPELVMQARGWRIGDLLELGKIAEADLELQEYTRATKELRLEPAHCWAVYRSAMRALLNGRFEEAERLSHLAFELGGKVQAPDAGIGFLVQMFTLRREQGRLVELEAQLRGVVDWISKIPAWRVLLGLLYVESGRVEEARQQLETLAAGGIDDLPRDLVWLSGMAGASELCALLGDEARAAILYEQLRPFAARNVVIGAAWVCWGSASLPLALLATTLSRLAEAERHFQDAIEWNLRMSAYPFVARSRYHYARMLLARDGGGDREKAVTLADEALATAEELGMVVVAGKVRELRARIAVGAKEVSSSGRREKSAAVEPSGFIRNGGHWMISHEGVVFRLKDGKGLRMIAHLLRNPGVDCHVTELVVLGEGGSGSEEARRAGGGELSATGLRTGGLGDAGELLDGRAKAAYRERLADLRAEVEEAEKFNDAGRAHEARQEIEFLSEELSRAVGLGGRDRKAAAASERARLNVTRAIRGALEKIGDFSPALHAHLDGTIRTGTYCCYRPANAVLWTLDAG